MRVVRLAIAFFSVWMFAVPAQACSLIWPGYDGMTHLSDTVVVVDVVSVTPGERREGEGESLSGLATGSVVRVLKGNAPEETLTFEHRIPDVDYVCDWDIRVVQGGRYWVWLDSRPDGQIRTNYAIAEEDMSNADRSLVRGAARHQGHP